jgi:general secretion pathway protein D
MYKLLPSCFFAAIALAVAMLPISAATAEPKANPGQVIEQIEFRDVTVGDALRILSEQSSLNIISSKKAADIPVTMFLRRVTSMEVVEALAKTYNLWYQRDEDSNIVRIYTVEEYRLEQVEFKKEETEIFTLKNAKNALDLAETIQNLFSGRVRISYGQNQQQLMLDLQQRFARFDMVDKRKKQNVTFSSGGTGGGGNQNTQNTQNTGNQGTGAQQYGMQGMGNQQFGSQQSGNQGFGMQGFGNNQGNGQNNQQAGQQDGNNIANQIVGDAEDIMGLVDASSRHQSPIFVGVIKHQNRVLVRTRDIDAMNEIRAIHKRLDMESSMLLMEVKVLSIDLSDGYDSLFDFKVKTNNANVATGGATGTVAASELLDTGIRAASAAIPSPAMLATLVSNNFEARLQLLEKENRVTQLATPMLLTSNQEVSSFLMGSTIPVLINYTGGSSTTTSLGPNQTTQQILEATPIYEQRTIGNTLLLTPNINTDNTVSVQIVVEEAALLKNGATILVPVKDKPPQPQLIDIVTEKTFSGSVIAKSGTAVAVGGIIQENAGGRESKVPVLGDIPGLGFFFREDHQTRARTELVIIIKPHIINSPVEAESISKEMLANNSVHPNAVNADSLDIYSNPDKRHKGYVLDQPYKEYSKQDVFDKFRERGDSREFSNKPPVSQQSEPEAMPANQQVYVDLTRYASEAVRVSGAERKVDPKITPVRLSQFVAVDLTYDTRIKALPIAGWKQGGVYVTAIELHNSSPDKITVDYRHLKGKWLASTIENETLEGRNRTNSVTYLYLISSQPFEETMAQAKR